MSNPFVEARRVLQEAAAMVRESLGIPVRRPIVEALQKLRQVQSQTSRAPRERREGGEEVEEEAPQSKAIQPQLKVGLIREGIYHILVATAKAIEARAEAEKLRAEAEKAEGEKRRCLLRG